MPAPRRTDYDTQAFADDWVNPDLTVKEIARRYDTSPSSVCRAALSRGLPTRSSLLRNAVYDTPRFKAMWHDPDVLAKKIAARFGVHPSTVSVAAKRRGWPSKYHIRAGVM